MIRSFDIGHRFPEGVTVGEGAVWVAAQDLDPRRGELLRLNPTTGDIEARIAMPVPSWEWGGAGLATGLGSVWVAAGSSGGEGGFDAWLYRIDPSTNTVEETIDVGRGSSSDVWVSDTGIWVLASEDRSYRLFHLDPDSHAVVATTDIPATWSQSVAESGGSVWISGNTDDSNGAPPETLFQVDPTTYEIVGRSQPADGQAFTLVASGDRLWFDHGGLRALDGTTGEEVVGPLDLPAGCCSSLTPDGVGGVWVLGTEAAGERAGLWHVDLNGVVDQHSGSDLGPDVNGKGSAWDASTNSIWIVQGERTVSQIQIAGTSP
jgi:hypothetical protein